MPDTVADWLQRSAAAARDKPAIVAVDGTVTTHGALSREVASLGARLAAAGVHAGDIVVVAVPQGPRLLTTLLGVMSVATAFPVSPKDRNLDRLFDQVTVKALVATDTLDAATRQSALQRGIPILPAEAVSVPAVSPPAEQACPGPDDAAILVATSGTTAAPKIVAVSHASLSASVRQMMSWASITADDCSLCLMPLTHLHGLLRSTLPVIFSGGSVIVSPGFDEASVFAWIERLRPTYLTAAPGLFKALLRREARDVSSLRVLITGSDSIDTATIARIKEMFAAPLLQFYVLSEVAPLVAATSISHEAPAGAVGPVPQPWSAKIVGADGTSVPVGVEGEIAIHGGIVNPLVGREAPQHRFTSEGYLLTGDLGRLDAEGNLFVLGRVDDRIHRGGEKIDPSAVEEVLAAYPGVSEVAVFAMPDPVLGQRVAAAIVAAAGQAPDAADVQAFLAKRLFSYMVPERIAFVAALPANAAGKIARGRLADALGLTTPLEATAEAPQDAPLDEFEARIAKIFCRRLKISEVARQAGFFDLGGDSFGGVELLFEIEDEFGINIPPATFIANNSVMALAALLRAKSDDKPALKLVSLNAGGGLPPLFITYPPEGYVAFAGLMADALGPEQPIHAFNAPRGPHEPAEPETMEEKAAKMVELIKAVQPRGPYYIAGYSFGAQLAFEIARQLDAVADPVAFVGIIDDQADLQQRWFAVEHVPFVPFNTLNCNHWALRRHVPKPYPGRVTLFRAEGSVQDYLSDPLGGWGDLALGGVEVRDIAGDHESIIRTDGFRWGALLSSVLAKARRAASLAAGKKPRKAQKPALQPFARHLIEARAACKRGDAKTEIAEYRKAAASGALPLWAMRNLAEALLEAGNTDAALGLMQEALMVDPWPLKAFAKLAELQVKLKRFDGLEQLYAQARAIVPEDSDAMFDFGHLCRMVNKMPEAEAALRHALELDELRAYGHHSRGHKYSYLAEILQHVGRLDEAIAAGKEAVNCHPDDAEKAAKLAFLYAAAGEKGEAADWYRRALVLNPSMPGVQERLKDLTRIG